MKKSNKGVIISVIVLAVVMLGCFIAGGISLGAGIMQGFESMEIPAMFEQFGIEDGVSSLMEYVQYVSGGERISYNSEYVSEPYTLSGEELSDVDTLVIENVGYNIVLKGMPRTDAALSFSGKFPSTVETSEIFTCTREGAALTFSGIEMPGHFNAAVGTVTIYIPSDFDGDIIIRDCMGDAEFTNIHAANFRIEKYAGEIEGADINAEKVELYSVAGEVDLSGKLGAYSLDSCAGEFSFNSKIEPSGDSTIKNTAGETAFNLPDTTEIYIINYELMVEVECELDESSSGAQFSLENVMGEVTFE